MSLGLSTTSLFGSNPGTGFNSGTNSSNLITYTNNNGNFTGTIPPIKVTGTKSTGTKLDWNNVISSVTGSLPGVLQGIANIKNGNQPVFVEQPFTSTYTGTANRNLFWVIGIVAALILFYFIAKKK